MSLITLDVLKHNLIEAQRNLHAAIIELDNSIQAARDIGADDFANGLLVLMAYIGEMNPTDRALQKLEYLMGQHKGLLELVELKQRARKIAKDIIDLPMKDDIKKLIEAKLSIIMEEVEKRKA